MASNQIAVKTVAKNVLKEHIAILTRTRMLSFNQIAELVTNAKLLV